MIGSLLLLSVGLLAIAVLLWLLRLLYRYEALLRVQLQKATNDLELSERALYNLEATSDRPKWKH